MSAATSLPRKALLRDADRATLGTLRAQAAAARAALAKERADQAEIRRIERANRAILRAYKSATRSERRAESDDTVRGNLPPHLVGLFDRVKRSIKGGPRETRTEAFLRYAEANPAEYLESIDDVSEALIRDLERSLAAPPPAPRVILTAAASEALARSRSAAATETAFERAAAARLFPIPPELGARIAAAPLPTSRKEPSMPPMPPSMPPATSTRRKAGPGPVKATPLPSPPPRPAGAKRAAPRKPPPAPAPPPMIFSWGYSGRRPAELAALASSLRATVIDCRGVPSSRRPGWSRAALENLLGTRYEWRGATLGNMGENRTTDAGLAALGRLDKNAILLCMEAPPGDCHRHHLIGLPLAARGVTVHHIFESEVFTATELQRAIDSGGDYSCDDLADVVAEVAASAR